MELTQEQWDKALEHTQTMLQMAEELPQGAGVFYVIGCKEYLKRYLDGERTEELYNDMINLH